MAPDPATPAAHASISETFLRRALGGMSVFTIVMTVPQIWTIWITSGGRAFRSVLERLPRDRNIYLPCIGWISADSAVILGALVYG